jgi:hypothetical protein
MLPKGKLLALVMIFAAIGLITASGAFTTVTADRQANLGVEGDSAALLQLEPHSSTSLATNNSDELTIDLSSNSRTSGLNTNATTLEDRLVNITNNGETSVAVSVTASTNNNANVTFYVMNSSDVGTNLDSTGSAEKDSFDTPDGLQHTRYNISDPSNNAARVKIGSGQTVTVGMAVNTTGLSQSDSIFSDSDNTPITVSAIDENATSGSTQLVANETGLGYP